MKQLDLRTTSMKKRLRVEAFLAEMDKVLPWERLVAAIKPFATERSVYSVELLLRIYCLQQWYNLSDPAMEEALYDRRSFAQFAGLDGFTDGVPDETTILRFRHLLEKNHLTDTLFKEVNQYLEEKGLVMKRGSIVDATIIEAPVSKKNASGERDTEMTSTKKNNRWYFGAKGHIGVQYEGLPLIHSVRYTTASRNDGAEQYGLFHGEERAKFGDAAYIRQEDKREARAKGVYYGMAEKRRSGQKSLSGAQKKKNRRHASIRAKVEHPFKVIKAQWGHAKVRYKGLFKNACQFTMLCGLSNLFFSRKALLAMG
jgi:transposase, IS5 family